MTEAMQRTLDREAYISDDHFERERERILYREWQCLAREEDLSEPGHYLVVEVAGESVILVRDREGALRGFYNVCRHRGARLAGSLAEAGCSQWGRFGNAIRCPYHSWTYGLTGELRHAPFLTEEHGLRKEDLGLHPVDVEAWGGFVFVHLTPSEPHPGLGAALGAIPDRLRRYPLGELRRARRIEYDVAANWKVILENYNECYHCGPVHPELCDVIPAFKRRGGAGLDWDQGIPHRDGAWTFTRTGTAERAPFPGLSKEERTRHKGELVYPNLMLSLAADHVAAFTLWPRSSGRTVVACDFLFHPDEVVRPGFDPSDAVDFWDLVNRQDWEICERVQAGMSSRIWSHGYYAPMEDASLDIRRYVGERMGEPT
jgi:Rieske 2Fe-2S family protein